MSNARAKAAQRRREQQRQANEARAKARKGRVTSSSNRSARSKASRLDAAKKTRGSAGRINRMREGRGSQRVTNSANRPSGGTAKVTASSGGSARTKGGPSASDARQWQKYQKSAQTSGRGPVKGSPGTEGAPTNARKAVRSVKSQKTANRLKRIVRTARQARADAITRSRIKGIGKAGAHGAAAWAGINAGPVADGTLKGKPTGPKKGPAVPKRLQKAAKPNKYKAGTFQHAFKAARNAGKESFTFNGKKYAVKLK